MTQIKKYSHHIPLVTQPSKLYKTHPNPMLHIALITHTHTKKEKKKEDLLNKNLCHRQLVNLSSLPTSTCDVHLVSIQLTILQANRYTHMYLSMYVYIHIYVCMYVKKKESANFLKHLMGI